MADRIPVRSRRRARVADIRLRLAGLAALALSIPVAVLAGPPADEEWLADSYLKQQLEPAFYSLPENVEILQLENGLQVILMRNPAQPMVGIYTQVKVGSAYEDFRSSGMSHMLEHLLFNGTEEFTQEELYELVDLHGAYNNANTSDFYTNFMTVLPAASLETGLKIQSQMLFHSIVPPDKFEKERGIIIGELVSGRDMPGHVTERIMRQLLFENSSLALPTLGTKSTIEHMSRDDVYAFYKNHYVPNNMTVTLAGGFDRDRALAWLEDHYGNVPPGTVKNVVLQAAEFLDRTRTVVRRGGDRRLLTLAFDAPGYGSPDFFPFLVMTRLLDAPATGILTRVLEQLSAAERPELTAWWQKADGFSRLVLEFELDADADPSRCYRLVQEAAAAALEWGITREDVLETVNMEETETLLDREQLRHTGIMTAEPIVLGGPDFFVSYLPRLREVSAEEVARVLDAYLIESPCLAALVEPAAGAEEQGQQDAMAGMKLPEGMKVPPAMLEAMKKAGMSMPKSGGDDQAGESKATSAGAGEQTAAGGPAVAREPLPIERTELPGGSILVTQQNPDSPLMAIHLAVRNRAVLDGDLPGALNLAHRLLLKGYSGCDQACLSHKLRRLGVVVKAIDNPHIPMDDYYTTGRFSFVRLETSAKNGPEALALVAELCQRASFSAEDFERESSEQIAILERRRDSARHRANELLRSVLYGSHPLVNPAEGDMYTLQDLSYDQVRTVYRRAFSPENLIFAIISPFPHERLAADLAQLLPGRGQGATELPPLPVSEDAQRATANLGGEMAAIRLGCLLSVEPPDVRAVELLTAVLSDRLAMDLREKRGLSYSVGASVGLHAGQGEFVAWLNPPRERADEGEEALRKFLADFDAATITQNELTKIRSARQGRMMLRRLSSISQAYYLAMAELDGNAVAYNDMLTAYASVTLDDLVRVDRKYLDRLPLATVVVD